MLAPLSWLKKYVEITLPTDELMWRLTEIGLTCEKIEKINNEDVLDIETTPNRPDWMSILGIAREIAAIENKKINPPKIEDPLLPPRDILPMKLNIDFNLFERWTAISITDIKIKESPKWIQDALKAVNLRPINNIVDITNFVMFEMGLPMHAFDYDEIKGKEMTVFLSKGGEEFTSVDEISYKLPKDAMVIRDKERIIDLAGIKGGLNSGIKPSTKNIFLHITINNPVIIRRTSIAMGLRSDASAIYERGPDKGGTLEAIKRAVNLIAKYAGGKPASKIIDIKKHNFKPEKKEISFDNLHKILGIKIKREKVLSILENLDLSPKLQKDKVVCIIPTRRADIKAEEDLAEEVARIYGYNNFPKTLPTGEVRSEKIPYLKDHSTQKAIREVLIASGFSETMNYSLISEEILKKCLLESKNCTKIKNPISKDFEFLRPSLIPSLVIAAKINQKEKSLKLFEIDKIYPSESYKTAGIARGISFRHFKGTVEAILERLNIKEYKIVSPTRGKLWNSSKSAVILGQGRVEIGIFGKINQTVTENFRIESDIWAFEFDIESLAKLKSSKTYQPISPYPPQIEDITFVLPQKTKIGEVISFIEKTSSLIKETELTNRYKDAWTFRITYQSKEKTLTDKEIEKIRNKIIKKISKACGGTVK